MVQIRLYLEIYMAKIYSEHHIQEDIKGIIEDTFDTCLSNREEVYWLITLLRAFMRVPNKNTSLNPDNMQLNKWQYEIVPVVENFMKKWKL